LRLSRPFYFTVLFYLGKTLGVHRRAGVWGYPRSSRRHSNHASGSDLALLARHPAGSNIARPTTPTARPDGLQP
jgi:hypothetical protein